MQVPENAFVDVGAMAFPCAWAAGKSQERRRIHLRGDTRPLSYLARMHLHEHVGIEYDPANRRDETGRFLPVRQTAP